VGQVSKTAKFVCFCCDASQKNAQFLGKVKKYRSRINFVAEQHFLPKRLQIQAKSHFRDVQMLNKRWPERIGQREFFMLR